MKRDTWPFEMLFEERRGGAQRTELGLPHLFLHPVVYALAVRPNGTSVLNMAHLGEDLYTMWDAASLVGPIRDAIYDGLSLCQSYTFRPL